ncbi:MarR family winged helix-turn-helix transcriptional regulator [Streptomyces sp. NPDC056411]|uniref:MarR family winged helix-turn-helix transcriptional regulator n=1 Tax=Streptomyces sp. NPDC056411 TaxID=3345813 RepID=UPI0035D80381
MRASELARASGRHKQVIGSLVDDLERLGYVERKADPADRRAKLICPTERGLLQMETAAAIMRTIRNVTRRRWAGRNTPPSSRLCAAWSTSNASPRGERANPPARGEAAHAGPGCARS